MPYIEVTAEELSNVSVQLTNASQSIGEELAGLGGQVTAMPWKGAAQTQFDGLWSEWQSSWAQLQNALEGISTLLGNAASTYTEAEDGIVRSMQGS